MLMLTIIMKNTAKNTIYIVQELRSQELHIFHNHLELNSKSCYLSATPLNAIPSHQYFPYIF